MGSTGLTFHVPVGLFLRRIFNVASSFTLTNYYFLHKKGELELEREKDTDLGWRKRIFAQAFRSCTLGQSDSARLSSKNLHTRIRKDIGLLPVSSVNGRGADGTAEEDNRPPNEPTVTDSPVAAKQPPSGSNSSQEPNKPEASPSPIAQLMKNPRLFEPMRKPRNPIVLCHGLYGYDVMGPTNIPWLQLHYWRNTMSILKKKIGAEVIITAVPGTGSIESRAIALNDYLGEKARGRAVNFLAHSMGGLDCRQLITHLKPKEYTPASLMTLCTPHHGSPFMDWCEENIGLGKRQQKAKEAGEAIEKEAQEHTPISSTITKLPSSLLTLLISTFDQPAYSNLTTHFLRYVFNPATPNDPNVRYYSVAARTEHMSIWHPLWLPKTVCDGVEVKEREAHPNASQEQWGNDGLVSVRSARWGEFLGTLEGCDHWDARGSSGVGGDAQWNIDLVTPIRNSLSDPLSNVNWGRLVGTWRKEEERREESERKTLGKEKREGSDAAEGDAMLKSSTERVSAMFDWVPDQAPSSIRNMVSDSPDVARTMVEKDTDKSRAANESHRIDAEKAKEGDEKQLKFDLERFYVALCRKLYDDGL